MAVYNMLLLVSLFWCLLVAVVHCQTVPYVSFMGDILTNHSYVDLTTVGEDISDPGNTVRRHTDLETCCGSIQGIHRGDWYFPDDSLVYTYSGDIYRRRDAQTTILLRITDVTSPSGIYRCQIPTNAVNDDVDTKLGEWVFVGLYPPSEGNIMGGGGLFCVAKLVALLHRKHTTMAFNNHRNKTGALQLNQYWFIQIYSCIKS